MNEFKIQSYLSVRQGFWTDYMLNRNSKRPARRLARHNLNGKELRKILKEIEK